MLRLLGALENNAGIGRFGGDDVQGLGKKFGEMLFHNGYSGFAKGAYSSRLGENTP
jgi:hypothetical protein